MARWHLPVLTACSLGLFGAYAAAQTPMKVLKVVPSADVAELDPTRAANQIGRIYSQMVFDTLFALDHTLSPKPMMVESETVSDGRADLPLHAAPGPRFHDGSPVTTRDVVASLERWMARHLGRRPAQAAADVAMAIVDDRTFALTLNASRFGLVEFVLAGAGAPMAAIMREADARRPDG